MKLFSGLKKKKESNENKEAFFKWVDLTLNCEIPNNTKAFCFNLYEDMDNKWSIELIGASKYDKENDDWACEETFATRNNPFVITKESDWNEIRELFINWLKEYLDCGNMANVLKQYEAVGIGFVDGDLTILLER